MTLFLIWSTPDVLYNPCNLPNTHYTHSYPPHAPPILASLRAQKSLPHSLILSLPLSLCLRVSPPLFCSADCRHQQCVCVVGRPRHIRPPLLALDSAVSKTCHPTRPLCRMDGGAQMPCREKRSRTHKQLFGNCPGNMPRLPFFSWS